MVKITSNGGRIISGDKYLTSYLECDKCGHQWKEGADLNSPECEKCGNNSLNIEIARKAPEWWKQH